jgi:hypothetical protein
MTNAWAPPWKTDEEQPSQNGHYVTKSCYGFSVAYWYNGTWIDRGSSIYWRDERLEDSTP